MIDPVTAGLVSVAAGDRRPSSVSEIITAEAMTAGGASET